MGGLDAALSLYLFLHHVFLEVRRSLVCVIFLLWTHRDDGLRSLLGDCQFLLKLLEVAPVLLGLCNVLGPLRMVRQYYRLAQHARLDRWRALAFEWRRPHELCLVEWQLLNAHGNVGNIQAT